MSETPAQQAAREAAAREAEAALREQYTERLREYQAVMERAEKSK